MHITLFILYGILCGYGIVKLPFFRRTGIKPVFLVLFFGLHVTVGCMHNVIAWRYYPGHGDTWDSFQWSLLLRNWLHTDFQHFLAANSRWTYFTHNGIIFIDLLLDFFSFHNLYVNTLLFAFPVFLGNTALYLVFRRHFPASPLTAIIVYLLPSTLFWTACIFREAVLYMLLGFLFYQLDLLFSRSMAPASSPSTGQLAPPTSPGQPAAASPSPWQPRAAQARTAIWACGCFILILYFRFAVGIFLLPALLAMYAVRNPSPKLFVSVAAVALVALGVILVFPPFPTWLLHGLTHWQAQFQVLEGHSRLFLPTMDGSWSSVLRTAPYALLNGLFEPVPGAGGRTIYLAFSIELILVWVLAVFAFIRSVSRTLRRVILAPGKTTALAAEPAKLRSRDGFAAACIVFALLGMIAVGAMVPFAGAIVRYRSIYLPFLLAPVLHSLRDLPLFRQLNQGLGNKL